MDLLLHNLAVDTEMLQPYEYTKKILLNEQIYQVNTNSRLYKITQN